MSNKNFKFSIIIAIYNTEEFLEEAIESIINQTIGFEDIELILVDDGSIDSSKDICLRYKEKYPDNIQYSYQENQVRAQKPRDKSQPMKPLLPRNCLNRTNSKFLIRLDSR